MLGIPLILKADTRCLCGDVTVFGISQHRASILCLPKRGKGAILLTLNYVVRPQEIHRKLGLFLFLFLLQVPIMCMHKTW